MQSEEPICPSCGAPMQLRTAKTGPYAGQKFYGCSRYPLCKIVIDVRNLNNSLDINDNNNDNKSIDKIDLSVTFFPRVLTARERIDGYVTWFFQNVAISQELLEEIRYKEIDENILKAFTQWRLDIPCKENKFEFYEEQYQVLSVMDKILKRGKITLISPKLEIEFQKKFCSDFLKLEDIKNVALRGYKKYNINYWLDSEEEDIFYNELMPNYLGENFHQFVIPQLEISSLINPIENITNIGKQRVDFAIFHPLLDEKILVELDGNQHKDHIERDVERDRILGEHNYKIIRIPAKEIRERKGEKLNILHNILTKLKNFNNDYNSTINVENSFKLLYAYKFAHQIQLSLLQYVQSGFINIFNSIKWVIYSDIDLTEFYTKDEALFILEKSVEDFLELYRKICNLYSLNVNLSEPYCNLISQVKSFDNTNSVCISFTGKTIPNATTLYINNIFFPFNIINTLYPSPPNNGFVKIPNKDILEYFLKYIFRKESFWEGQYDGIVRALQGKDALLLLPTGAGKSLVYQLASLLLPGITIVIDPIISLMEDQIFNLGIYGIDRCISITSQIASTNDRIRAINLFSQGEYLFGFIAPERFQTKEFRDSIRGLTVYSPISLIVIDEAHCVSEWGHDFRTSYLNIGRISREFCRSDGHIPPLLALTGTASRTVLKDVQRELQIEDFDAIITPKTFDRKELKFIILSCKSNEKFAKLKGYLTNKLPYLFNKNLSNFYNSRGKDTYSGLIFCPHVGGDFGIEEVSEKIKNELGINSDIYSGKVPKNWDPNLFRSYKQNVTKSFKRNEISLLVCTKAFGMGIDKPNIRYTIHYNVPPSIEAFYQEAGRAGRDKNISYCCVIVSNDDQRRTEKLLNPNSQVNEISEIISKIDWKNSDDITRILYFHVNSFHGIEKEKNYISILINHIGDISQKRKISISIPKEIKDEQGENSRQIVEKALHRLLIIGVVNDYTIDYSSCEFSIELSGASKEEIINSYGKYVSSYLFSRGQNEIDKANQFIKLQYPEFVNSIINLLLNFLYDVIERGRRRAFQEMLLACSTNLTDKDFRKRILKYLEQTEYSEELENLLIDINAGIVKCKDIFERVRSPNEAAELRGNVSKYLESYPDYPSFLMLRALSEIYSRDKDFKVAKENFSAAIKSAFEKYNLKENLIFDFIVWGISKIANRNSKFAKDIIRELIFHFNSRDFAIILIKNLSEELLGIPAWFLLDKLNKDCKTKILK